MATAQHVGPDGHGLLLPKIGRPRRTVRPEGIPSTACLRQSLRTGSSSAKRRLEGLRCPRSEEHTSELQSLMRISYAVFCLKKTHIHIHYNYNSYIIIISMTLCSPYAYIVHYIHLSLKYNLTLIL